MPRNGSGTYSLPSGNPVVPSTTIQSTWANSTLTDVGDALTGSLARDGTGGMSGALRLADGTVAIPGLAFTSETTTGFSRPTTNALVASVSAIERLRINASGATVSGTLGVSGAAALSSTLAVTDDVAVNTNKFNVTAVSGNTSIAGTLGVAGLITATGGVSGSLASATGLPLTTGVTGTLPVANGGTGATTLTADNVVLGNGTSAVQFVAPGTAGNVLTSNGTTWSSTAPATPPAGPIPAGTAMLFAQTSAPTGWTKSTTHDNKALRVVNGTASSGGSVAFTAAFASQSVAGTVGNTTLTIAQMPAHTHTFNGSNTGGESGFVGSGNQAPVNSSSTGGGGSHTHSFTGTAINLAVQYVDVIIATKD